MREGQIQGATIRVFYPNPISSGYQNVDTISKVYNVTYIIALDPIYHELVFIDDQKTRHTIIGLAYHLEEKLENAGGIDGAV
jgi:hypothetical protein